MADLYPHGRIECVATEQIIFLDVVSSQRPLTFFVPERLLYTDFNLFAGRQIELEDLPAAISQKAFETNAKAREERAKAASEGRSIGLEIELPSAMNEVEERVIKATLDYTAGDKTNAAKLLHIGRKTLYRKLKQYEKNDS